MWWAIIDRLAGRASRVTSPVASDTRSSRTCRTMLIAIGGSRPLGAARGRRMLATRFAARRPVGQQDPAAVDRRGRERIEGAPAGLSDVPQVPGRQPARSGGRQRGEGVVIGAAGSRRVPGATVPGTGGGVVARPEGRTSSTWRSRRWCARGRRRPRPVGGGAVRSVGVPDGGVPAAVAGVSGWIGTSTRNSTVPMVTTSPAPRSTSSATSPFTSTPAAVSRSRIHQRSPAWRTTARWLEVTGR